MPATFTILATDKLYDASSDWSVCSRCAVEFPTPALVVPVSRDREYRYCAGCGGEA